MFYENLKQNNVFTPHYIIIDPEFFIAGEPDFDEGPLKTIKISTKTSLNNVSFETDPK